MPAYVSALQEEVRNEHRAWPFQLDCRRDIAAIELAGVVYRIRPLRWREKCNLARYVRVGEEFLQRHLIRVCLANDAPLPEEQDDYEALLALTRWINAPGEDQAALPLDATLLAGVAMSVAQQMGVRPSQLAHEAAEFVERLWATSAAPEGASAETAGEVATRSPRMDAAPLASATSRQVRFTPSLPHPGDMNRIRILPDPEPVASRANADAQTTATRPAQTPEDSGQGASAAARAGLAVPAPDGTHPAGTADAPPPAARTTSTFPSPPAAAPPEAAAHSPVAAHSAPRTSPSHSSSRAARQTAHFRVRLPGDRPAAPSHDASTSVPIPAPVWTAPPEGSRPTAASELTAAAPDWHAAAWPNQAAPEQRERAAWPNQAAPERRERAAWPNQAALERRERAAWPNQTAPRPAGAVTAAAHAIADPDELFEELADRLEQAAEQMGIDL